MPCEIAWRTGVSKGDGYGGDYFFSPVYYRDYPHNGYPNKMKPEDGIFAYTIIDDADIIDVENMVQTEFSIESILSPWDRKLLFVKIAEVLSIDAYRYEVSAENAGASNLAGIDRDMVENYLTDWNAEVFSASTNLVTFDFAVYEDDRVSVVPGSLQSRGFWGYNVSAVSFNEVLYTQVGGIHRIRADYSQAVLMNDRPDKVASVVYKRGGEILSHSNGVIEFNITRNDVFRHFKNAVSDKIEAMIEKKIFRVSPTTMDTIDASGGVMHISLNQLQNYLINKLDD